jgi:hypothetical protein
MTDQGSTPPPDPNQPGGYGAPPPPAGGYGATPPAGGYGQPPAGGGYGAPPPVPGYGQPAGPPPPNYLVWAILTTVLCCPPLGIPSIVFASQVNSKWAAGDVAGAQASSAKAKKFAIWSAIAGAVISVIYIVILVAAAGSDSTT